MRRLASIAGVRRREEGFSLLEVVVAFTVFAVAITGIVYLSSMATTGNKRSQDQAAATALAIDRLEQLKNLGFSSSSLVSGSDTSGIYSRSWTVGSQYTLAGVPAKDLTVSVSWTGGGSVSLTTTRVNPPDVVPGLTDGIPTVSIKSWKQQ